MLLGDIRTLRNDPPILTEVFDPQLVEDKEIRVKQAIEFRTDMHSALRTFPALEEFLRKPLGYCELPHMWGAGKEVRMCNVFPLKIKSELFALLAVPYEEIGDKRHRVDS
jgi:hypothetical protein